MSSCFHFFSVKFQAVLNAGAEDEETVYEIVAAKAIEEESKKGPPTVVLEFESPCFTAHGPCKADLEVALNGIDFVSAATAFTYVAEE